jgi:hypothetical protein
MKAFWKERSRGVDSDHAVEVDIAQAGLIWSDELLGIEGNFFGLIDDAGRTIQFRFEESIPDHVDDAGHLTIFYLDFPMPELKGSYGAHVKIKDVHGLIKKAFEIGADHRKYQGLMFAPW